jgi:hypothetical protein
MSITSGKRFGLGGEKRGKSSGRKDERKGRNQAGEKSPMNRWRGPGGVFDDVILQEAKAGKGSKGKIKKRDRQGRGGGGEGRDHVTQLTAALVKYVNSVPRQVQDALEKHLRMKVSVLPACIRGLLPLGSLPTWTLRCKRSFCLARSCLACKGSISRPFWSSYMCFVSAFLACDGANKTSVAIA